MKHNRYIPYAYTIRNNEIAVIEAEGNVVSEVFRRYIDGESLKAIADSLNASGVIYLESNPTWNKNMIKRMLDNDKYCGEENYPPIISKETFDKAHIAVNGRRQFKPTTPFVTAVKHKVFCSECGCRYVREFRTDNSTIWYCNECKTTWKETNLETAITEMVESICSNPVSIHKDISQVKTYQATTEVIKLSNEIARKMEKPEDKIAEIKQDILKCAAMKYDCCRVDLTPIISETLKTEYSQDAESSTYVTDIIEKTVSTILISGKGEIQMKLKNGAIVTAKI